jgi:hypothetical protein
MTPDFQKQILAHSKVGPWMRFGIRLLERFPFRGENEMGVTGPELSCPGLYVMRRSGACLGRERLGFICHPT